MRGCRLAHICLLAVWCGVCVAPAPPSPAPAAECGPYGFVCETRARLRLCGGGGAGAAFLCPADTLCSEASAAVCEHADSPAGPAWRGLRCRRAERLPDPATPGCKGYVLCIPDQARFRGVRYSCAGGTVFNARTRACTAPHLYTCPHPAPPPPTPAPLFQERPPAAAAAARPIDCKDYRLSAARAAGAAGAGGPLYFCPARPPPGARAAPRCTVFSAHFCILLERDPADSSLPAHRKPRELRILM